MKLQKKQITHFNQDFNSYNQTIQHGIACMIADVCAWKLPGYLPVKSIKVEFEKYNPPRVLILFEDESFFNIAVFTDTITWASHFTKINIQPRIVAIIDNIREIVEGFFLSNK